MIFAVFTKTLPAYVLVTAFPVTASDAAAFITQKFHFSFLLFRKAVQSVQLLIQSEIRNNILKFISVQFIFESVEACYNLRR